MKKSLARLRALIAYTGQCSQCGGVFDDWDGGVFDACRNNGH